MLTINISSSAAITCSMRTYHADKSIQDVIAMAELIICDEEGARVSRWGVWDDNVWKYARIYDYSMRWACIGVWDKKDRSMRGCMIGVWD